MQPNRYPRWVVVAFATWCVAIAAAAQPVEEVIVIAPGSTAGIAKQRFPGNAQTASDIEMSDSGALNITEFMQQNLGSIQINDAQNNPYQPELFYRGFGSSSLLGFPQGISIYVDGVRRNELFGDVVNWDTIPDAAIARIDVIPGSNPVFGLNTLGGAMAMSTKDGFRHGRTAGELSGGSFGRFTAHAETGDNRNGIGWYASIDGFTEDGWRPESDSDVLQGFAKLSFTGTRTDTDVAVTLTDSELRGNGATPEALLAIEGRDAVFTFFDLTENRLAQINGRSVFTVSDRTSFTSGLYYRRTDTDTFNGDGSEFEPCEDVENSGLLCERDDGEEEVIIDQVGLPVAATEAVDGGTDNTSETRQDTIGASLQANLDRVVGTTAHRILLGASVDYGDAEFRQRTELARLTADRFTVGSGLIAAESITDVDTRTLHAGLYVSDTASLSDRLDVTLSARYNYTDVEIRDNLIGGGDDDEDSDGSGLNGDHTFKRFNPAIAMDYQLNEATNLFASYAQSSRAPTPAELTCANPDDPCRLPNAFVDDPPLDEVVTRTFELGARGGGAALGWSVAAFNALSADDILFISDGTTTTQGYFDNVGDTRRRGVEIGVRGDLGRFRYAMNYTYINAEFRDRFLVNSPNHPLRDPGDPDRPAAEALIVKPGNRIPGIPEHLLRINAGYDITDRVTIGADLLAQSDQVFRGDESNTGDTLDGFVLVNLNASYRLNANARLTLRVNNLFDSDYETFGVYGDAAGVLGDEFREARRFVGVGAPRGAWVGLEVRR